MADMEAVLQKTVDYFGGHIPGVAAFLVKIIVCIVIYIIGKNVIGWVVKTVRSMLLRTKMQTGAATFIVSMVKIFLYLILIFGLAMQFGVKESSVAALVASGGVAIGLALQGSLANLAGGVLILLLKPFQVGDYIITPQSEGTVQSIDIFYTRLTTTDNRVIVIPNGTISNSDITNTTKQDRRLLVLEFSVSYDADVALIRDILLKEMKHRSDILVKEPMRVVVTRLSPVKLRMNAKCWVETSKYWDVYYDMLERIKTLLQEQNISIG